MMMVTMNLFSKNNFDFFFQDKTIKTAWTIFGAILFASLLALFIFWRKLPPQIPLYYSSPWGEEQLAQTFFILILPLSSLAFGLVNLFLAVFFFDKQPLASKILSLAAVVYVLLSSLALVKIIFLVI